MAGEEDINTSGSSAKSGTTAQRLENMVVSPYTLSNSDNPGVMISSVVLTGENYNEWATEMWNALQAKRKTGFINGVIRKPTTSDPNFENWTAVNSMIVGWIRTSIEPKVKSTVSFISDAYLLWEDLKQRFSVGNKVRVHQLKAELASCRQDGQPVLDYFGRLSKIWEEYQIYKPIKVCTCGLCTCGLSNEQAKEREEEKIHQFVLGLDESRFGGMSTNIIAMDSLPSLGEVYSRVVREEQRLSTTRIREQQQEAVGFMVRREQGESRSENFLGNKPDSLSVRSRAVCSHCGRTGHEKRTAGNSLASRSGGSSDLIVMVVVELPMLVVAEVVVLDEAEVRLLLLMPLPPNHLHFQLFPKIN